MSRNGVEQAAPVELVDDNVALVLAFAADFLTVVKNQAKHIRLTRKRGLVEEVPRFRIEHDHAESRTAAASLLACSAVSAEPSPYGPPSSARATAGPAFRGRCRREQVRVVRFGDVLRRLIGLAEIISRIDELDCGAAQIHRSDDRRRESLASWISPAVSTISRTSSTQSPKVLSWSVIIRIRQVSVVRLTSSMGRTGMSLSW